MDFFGKKIRHQYSRRSKYSCQTLLLIIFAVSACLLLVLNNKLRHELRAIESELVKFSRNMLIPLSMKNIDFEGFDNNTGTFNGCYLVPNILHFIKFNERTFSFIEMVCILAAYKRQRPEAIYIHTNAEEFIGKYWDIIRSAKGIGNVLIVRPLLLPQTVFGIPMNEKWRTIHGSDLLRIILLMEFGGIYLNTDVFMVKDLNDFRRFEMTIGWKYGQLMGNQIMMAHKGARFLGEYLISYKKDYNPDNLVYNSIIKPTYDILNKQPYLVHRVEEHLGVYVKVHNIYLSYLKNWKDYYTLSLSINDKHSLSGDDKTSVPMTIVDKDIVNYKNSTIYKIISDLFNKNLNSYAWENEPYTIKP